MVILVHWSMKMNYKKILTIGLGGVAMMVVLAPLLVSAQNNTNQGLKGFCQRLSSLYPKVDQSFTNQNARLEEKRAEIQNRIKECQTERNNKLEQKRAKWDANRAEHFAKLEERAQNDAQKQALLAFHQAVTAAIKSRRAAVDAAIQNFRQGITEAIASRKTTGDEAVYTFRNSVRTAYQNAQSDCDSDLDPATIRQRLKAEIKAARGKFTSDQQQIEKLSVNMESLIAAKREAIEKANEDFRTVIEKAREDFKAAFQQATNSPSPAESD